LVIAFLFLKESNQHKIKDKAFRFKPISDLLRELKKPVIRELFMINFIFITAFSMMQITASILWVERYLLNEKQVGFVFMFIGLVSAIVQGGLVGKLTNAFGEKKLLIIGSILMVLGLTSIPFVPVHEFYLQLLSLAFIAVGNGCITPSLTSLISQSAQKGEQGQALGMNQSFGSLARVVGPAFGGLLYDQHYTLPYIVGGGLMIICYTLAKILFKQNLVGSNIK
jgi:MFS family permease